MRVSSRFLTVLTVVAACGGIETPVDAASIDGPDVGPIDAAIDTPAIDACATRTILAGGSDPAAQGWTVIQSGAAAITMPDAMTTRLATQTVGGVGSHLLLSLPVTAPYSIEATLQVVAVAPHNAFDAAVAILGGFTPSFGVGIQREQMIYVDADAVGWADDSARIAAATIDGAYHRYRLDVDATATATVYRDDQPVLARAGFVTNGTIALGDQTNEGGVESTILLRSVTLRCR